MREIAAVTFTEKAAAELRDRIRRALERDARTAPTPSRRRDAAPRRSTSSTAPRCPPCTRSRSGSSPSTRSRPASRRASRCSTTSRRRWRSRSAGPASSTSCSTIPRSSARCCSRSTPTPTLDRPAHHRARVQRQLGPRRRAHGSRARPAAARRSRAAASASSTALCALGERVRRPPTTSSLERARPISPRGATQLGTRPTSTSSCGCSPTGLAEGQRDRGPQGQLAVDVRRRAVRAAVIEVRERRRSRHRRGHRGRGAAPGVGARAVHPARGRRARAAARRARVPRPARARPRGAARSRARLGRPPPPPRPLHAPAARRVPGHRSDPVRPRRAARVGRSRRARPARGTRSTVDPGRLFVVGDPKQSIYRFRRADIAAFLARPFGVRGGAAPPHPQLPHRPPGDRLRQPRVPRAHRRRARVAARVRRARARLARRARSGPPVVLLGADATSSSCRRPTRCASARRPTSPRSSARALRERLVGVTARTPTAPSVCEPCRLGDICILLPARTSLGPARGRARRRRHPVPGRDVVARLRHAARSATCCMVLQAVDDPTDELALVSALRSPLFGCGDDDLFTFQRRARRPVEPPGAAARVAAGRPPGRRGDARARGVARRAALARRRASCSTASCASAACSRSAFAHGRPRDLWRRVRFVIDQARAFSEPTAEPAAAARATSSRWADLAEQPRARASSRPCCPRPTTTRCASSPSTAPRASSSRSRSCRA